MDGISWIFWSEVGNFFKEFVFVCQSKMQMESRWLIEGFSEPVVMLSVLERPCNTLVIPKGMGCCVCWKLCVSCQMVVWKYMYNSR